MIARYVTGTTLTSDGPLATPTGVVLQLRREMNDVWLFVAGFMAFVLLFLFLAIKVR